MGPRLRGDDEYLEYDAVTSWVRFRHQDQIGFGTLSGQSITVHHGDMFDSPKANGKTLSLAEVELMPCDCLPYS